MMKWKKWRNHYITFLANLFVFLGFSTNAILIRELNPIDNSRVLFSPEIMIITALIGGLLGIAFIGFDIKFFVKDFFYQKFHYDKKFTKMYIGGISVYLFNIILGMLFVVLSVNFYRRIDFSNANSVVRNFNLTRNLIYISIGITSAITIVNFVIIRLARLFIEQALDKRKNNTDDNPKPVNSDDKSVIISFDQNNSQAKEQPVDVKPEQKPSGGLSEL
ncbi:DUF5453 family protein [Mycoplasma tullyi]|uniref:DUF5453 family protein n=1 Tax=Mycoplasma tullyi TaxID=1612150 RepID=A0A7D7Y5R3_9MOLU|nr:DUF5453 family protein [Mycoplasma tullyi]QMT98356.1 DUF5453 family protein [Mycoplasma tullyi]